MHLTITPVTGNNKMPIIVNSQPQLGKTTEYRLSIQADLNGFSFSVTDPQQKKLLFLYGSEFTMEGQDMDIFSKRSLSLFKEQQLLRSQYSSVEILFGTSKFATIPGKIYKSEEDLQTLQRLHILDELDEIHSYMIPQEDMVVVYPVNSTFLNVIKEFQPKFSVFPTIGTYITYLPCFHDYNKIFFQYFKGVVTVIAAEGSRIVLCNSYPAAHFNSALYFLLLAMKEVQFNAEQTTVFISGNIRDLEVYDIAKYFSKVKYFRNPEIPLPDFTAELRYSTLMFER
jgi:hypothetical protein